MPKRIKKPPVKPERIQDWVRRNDSGESPPEIAAKDGFDVRTVRSHLDKAKEEREVKEARSIVLRNALERHYTDLCDYAGRISPKSLGESKYSPQDEHLRIALRQHLPRSPIWSYLNKRNALQQEITELKQEAERKLGTVKSDPRLSRLVRSITTIVMPGIIGALSFQIGQWAQGMQGLNLKDNFSAKPADKGFVDLNYGFSQMGKVRTRYVQTIHDVLGDWEAQIRQWEEFQKLEKSYTELKRVEKNLADELFVITLRRIVPGHCKYCPL